MNGHTLRRRALPMLLGALLCAQVALQAALSPAHAEVPTPVVTSPGDGTSDPDIPTLTWERVDASGDVRYEAKLFNAAGVQLETSGVTVNSAWTPTVQAPTGTELTLQVQTVIGGQRSSPTAVHFTRANPAAPALEAPSDGAVLTEPGTPLVYEWAPVPGAYNYTIEVGPSADLDSVDPALISKADTSGTTYAPNVVPTPGRRYWRVIANFDSGKKVRSEPSQVRSYDVEVVIRSGGEASVPQEPIRPADGLTTTVTDVVLQWHPIDGAVTYTLQYGTEPDFTNATTVKSIKSTRYSPATTLANNQYYWRVAPVFANGVDLTTLWDQMPVWRFQRKWPDQPSLVHPADDTTVSDPVHYEWAAARWASRYRLQVSPNASFTPASSVMSCDTKGTTYAPYKQHSPTSECWPQAAGTFYWRVVAYDDPAQITTEVTNATVHRFTYHPDRVTLRSPGDGADVSVPTLTWSMLPRAAKYEVTITPVDGGSTITKQTYATSFTPLSRLTVGTSYRWDVVPVYGDGRTGAPLVAEARRTFTVVADDTPAGSAPIPTGPTGGDASGVRPPDLTWTPVEDATSYRVLVRRAGSSEGFTTLSDVFVYPTGTDSAGQKLQPDTYEWYVQAQTPSGPVATPVDDFGTFTMLPLDEPTGEVLALTGSDAAGPSVDACEPVDGGCSNLRQTPVFTWDPVPGAAQYRLYLAQDASNTNPVQGYPVLVKNTMFVPPETLPDSEAGSGYFYRVVPCWTTGNDPLCNPLVDLEHTFSKVSHSVQLVTPDGVTQDNDIILDWDDYHCTLRAITSCTDTQVELPVGPGDGETTVGQLPAVGTKQYRVQVSLSRENMSGTQQSLAVVDQSSFTETGRTYPEGPLYWRVQAIDGSGRNLPWSEIRTVTKESGRPTPTSATGGEALGSDVTLGWSSTPFAKTYDVQIFRSTDPTTGSPYKQQLAIQQTSWAPPYVLAPGGYRWRVRRLDVDGRPGGWSGFADFSTTGAAPSLTGPAPGATVPQRAARFSWQPATVGPRASRYRLLVKPSTSSTWQQRLTYATSYAWPASLAPDTWTWKVEALAGDGTVLGTSPERSFTVVPLNRPVQIQGTGVTGTQLELAVGSWNASGVTASYQWLRNGSAITGATAPTYELTSTDEGRAISLRVIGRHPAYDQVTLTSSTVAATARLSVVNTVAPGVSGTRALGHVLTASPGSWRLSNGAALPREASITYQWLRDGTPITGATAATRTVAKADVGRQLRVRVRARLDPDYAPGTASTPGYRIKKVASSTTMRLRASVIPAGSKPKVTVTVAALLTPTGRLKVYDGRALIKTVRLARADRGRTSFPLPKRSRGLHYLKTRYTGSVQVAGSTSPKVRLRVR